MAHIWLESLKNLKKKIWNFFYYLALFDHLVFIWKLFSKIVYKNCLEFCQTKTFYFLVYLGFYRKILTNSTGIVWNKCPKLHFIEKWHKIFESSKKPVYQTAFFLKGRNRCIFWYNRRTYLIFCVKIEYCINSISTVLRQTTKLSQLVSYRFQSVL